MLLNEHQSKILFREAGVETPDGVAVTPENHASFTPSFPSPWYAKAQVLAGGRGKAGGVLRVDRIKDLPSACEKIFALEIKGQRSPFLRLEPASSIARELYLSFVVSRDRESLVFSVSPAGGMEVEEQAGAILAQEVPARGGLDPCIVRTAFFHLNVDKSLWRSFDALVRKLYAAVCDYGLLLAEINPLALTPEGDWLALDGKVEIDDNVRDLRPELERFYEPGHASYEENQAREAGLSYVRMEGWVGLLVNGAGLAMATMDLLNFSGLPAANFMDLGGAADRERMRRALGLLFGNNDVKAVFLNLFGGIVSCEAVARAMAEALDGNAPPKPVVVRMAGNGSPEGRDILAGLNQPAIRVFEEMGEALTALRGLRPSDAPAVSFPRVEEVFASPASPQSDTLTGDVPELGLGAETRILVQGATGKTARLHTRLMQEYGANVVAGVTPFKGGQEVLGFPVYDSVAEALKRHEVDASIVFVPAVAAADAVLEAASAGIPWVVCITEGIPQRDMLALLDSLESHPCRLIGPNTPGIIVPGKTKIGIMPGHVFTPGPVAVFSRSGTLTYEAAARLSAEGIGQSFGVGIGGDPFVGMRFVDLLEIARYDDATEAVIVLGEIGGRAEEELAAHIRKTGFPKPLLAFVAGRTAPPGKRLGHAGAILEEGAAQGIEGKLDTLRQAGFTICPDLESIPALVRQALG